MSDIYPIPNYTHAILIGILLLIIYTITVYEGISKLFFIHHSMYYLLVILVCVLLLFYLTLVFHFTAAPRLNSKNRMIHCLFLLLL